MNRIVISYSGITHSVEISMLEDTCYNRKTKEVRTSLPDETTLAHQHKQTSHQTTVLR